MLVITRKEQERVVMYDEDGKEIAVILLVKSTDGKAQIGFEAPRSVRILRHELIGREPMPIKEGLCHTCHGVLGECRH